ncbi:OsmC family protein [Microvirga thermotolerans]|uniref:OsmC family peroxiredoxin n=1 Tax=Microvirga thermotolerans TaxID=2651334 RepID=A0A5P9JSN1_9HYPH|nr:OsmC family protein [Microvirga thermotolerans]QFU15812.1 OsmC family peroxiredoxin [Microvirga thermotolerans]
MTHAYTAKVSWSRDGAVFTDSRYSRGHRWSFDGGITVQASSAPSSVPLPYSLENAVDPEEALVAAVSSCHMLTFLSLAAKKRFVVDSYEDEAHGVMTKNGKGKLYVSKVTLDPRIVFSGEKRPRPEQIAELHHLAHRECFIANSILAEVVVAGIPSH